MVPVISQIFELERLEKSLALIVEAATNIGVQTRFDNTTNETPQVSLEFRVGAPTGHRYIGYVGVNQFQPAQPLDSWLYELDATISTNRETNGSQHIPLIGRVRWSLQYFYLLKTLTPDISPYHTLTSIEETGQQDSVVNENTVQKSKITFRGILNIRESAWPPVA